MAWLRLDISIHALRKESDCRPCLIVVGDIISIHALRKESDSDPQVRLNRWNISIHALRKESDLIIAVFKNFDSLFQSTLSVRRATDNRGFDGNSRLISIHALRKESDLTRSSTRFAGPYFNPRSP